MDELVAAAAKATGMSENMVKRSAAARAKAQGTTVEAVLAEWAGVPVPEGEGDAAPSEAAAAPSPSEPAVAAEAAEPSESAESAIPAEAAASAVPVAPAESAPGLDVEESGEEMPASPRAEAVEPRAIREVVPAGAIPRWLAAVFVAVPLFALAYLGFLPNGPNCGDAGRLAVDPVSGEMVNCDGSAIGDEGEVDFFALGQEVYGRNSCIVCHGEGGAGAGNFPAFTGGALLTTFPDGQCSAQVEWVRLGTAQWPDPTYGANQKPVGGSGAVMPSFGSQLTDDQLKAVVLYERVAFGGQDLEAAKTDCLGGAVPAEG